LKSYNDKVTASSFTATIDRVDAKPRPKVIMWAIREGRQAAHSIDKALMGKTDLPR
jgi:glutamate synthase (NADPH) small chain